MTDLIFAAIFLCAGAIAMNVRHPAAKIGAVVAIGLGLVILVSSMVHVVPAGHRGVVVTFGSVNTTPLGEGFGMVNPVADVIDIDVRMRKDEETQVTETADTQTVRITLLLNWHVEPSRVADLYQRVGPDFAERLLPLATQESLKAEIAKYKVGDLVMKRPEIKSAVEAELREWLADDGLTLDAVAIGDVDFSDTYDDAIEAKQAAEQKALQAENEVREAKAEAAKVAATAKGAADAEVARATGEAESLRLRGTAQAEYNRLLSESLTDELLRKMYLETWDGKLPGTLMGGDAQVQMLMPMAQAK
jgi:prohibitin 2